MDNEKPATAAPGRDATKAEMPKADTPTLGLSSVAKDTRPSGAAGSETATGPMLPVAEPFRAISSAAPKERIGVFSELVTDDADIAGLVAYSIYKQNKLDWLAAFETAKGRSPNEEELASYIIGEGTPRRIATYRHLAEATLTGNGPGSGKTGPGPRVGLRGSQSPFGDKTPMIATYAVIALLFLIGLLLAAHYTMSSR